MSDTVHNDIDLTSNDNRNHNPGHQVQYYIGLMSGTSTDGVDAVLSVFIPGQVPRILASSSVEFTPQLRAELLALNQKCDNELERAYIAANQLNELFAQACLSVLAKSHMQAEQITAIGSHGQTIRHRPDLGFTVQINASALLAELTGIAVVSDFRSRDVAAGGQGAPLVPAFHQHLFASEQTRTILNLGGFANISIVRPQNDIKGFDTGPANVLLDAWCALHTGNSYDHNGQWASQGTFNPELLQYLLDSEPWFKAPVPKSTGRDLFNMPWLNQRLNDFEQAHAQRLKPVDVQATLCELTAITIYHAIIEHAADSKAVVVCGGGAKNAFLLKRLQHYLGCPVVSSDSLGVPCQSMEALAFAWLAWAHCNRVPAGLPTVTGAKHKTILGCYYPA